MKQNGDTQLYRHDDNIVNLLLINCQFSVDLLFFTGFRGVIIPVVHKKQTGELF
jgi:hypothetical protein